MGAVYAVLPAGCTAPYVQGQTYYLCGNTWFYPSLRCERRLLPRGVRALRPFEMGCGKGEPRRNGGGIDVSAVKPLEG